jgi:Lrp/AsnC family leucine-responsive transcriptional regulator
MNELDEIDLMLLQLLQHDGRISNSELAQRVGLAPPTVLRRVKLLEERGYIKGYVALLDPLLLELRVTAFMFLEVDQRADLEHLAQQLGNIPEVQDVHRVIGQWCVLLKIRTQTPQTLEHLLHHTIRPLLGIRRTETILVTSSPVESTTLTLPSATTIELSETIA